MNRRKMDSNLRHVMFDMPNRHTGNDRKQVDTHMNCDFLGVSCTPYVQVREHQHMHTMWSVVRLENVIENVYTYKRVLKIEPCRILWSLGVGKRILRSQLGGNPRKHETLQVTVRKCFQERSHIKVCFAIPCFLARWGLKISYWV